MYNVTLINLSADARSVADLAQIEQRNVVDDALRERLQNFCAIDPLENVSADAEIRVRVRGESYLLRTEHGKLILYDMNRRDLPAQLLTVTEAMKELDGTATASREQAIVTARATAPSWTMEPELPVVAPPVGASKPRVMAMTAASCLLLGAIFYLAPTFVDAGAPENFVPVEPAEVDGIQSALTGVYMTGNEPGQHGMVISAPGELKLFELGIVAAPRIVYASYRPGRVEQKLFLATDQPGGLIEVAGNETLVYGGEVYRRIP